MTREDVWPERFARIYYEFSSSTLECALSDDRTVIECCKAPRNLNQIPPLSSSLKNLEVNIVTKADKSIVAKLSGSYAGKPFAKEIPCR